MLLNSIYVIQCLVGLMMSVFLVINTTRAQADNVVFFSKNQFQVDEDAGLLNVVVLSVIESRTTFVGGGAGRPRHAILMASLN